MNKNYEYYNDHPFYDDFEKFIDGISERYGNKIAITYRNSSKDKNAIKISFRAFSRDVHALASEFYKKGMSGTHCAIIGGLSYEWICTYLAVQIIGAVAVPLDREWTGEDLVSTTRFAECKYIVYDSDIASKICECLSNKDITGFEMKSERENGIIDLIRLGDPYWKYAKKLDTRALSALVFTSGTTGKGKGVMLCQDGILNDIYNGLKLIRAGERSIVSLPPHHTYGSNIGILALLYAGTNIYLSSGLRQIVQEMKEFKPDFMVLVPLYVETFHKRIMASLREQNKEKLVSKARKLSGALRYINIDLRRKLFKQILAAFGGELKFIICGGAPLRPDLVKDFDDFGIALLNGYGITECSPLISVNRNHYNCVGSIGLPIPSMDVKIEEPNENGEGEICARGANVMLGYYKEPAETSKVLDKEHYFHTGDIGRIDENGVIYITGRVKNLIILSNGKNVYPEEIETAVAAIPGVSDVVVYEGMSRRGTDHNQIVAEIYPDKDFIEKNDIKAVNDYFRSRINEYNRTTVKYKQVGFVKVRKEEFPKNTLRKITRFKLDMTIE